MQLKVVSKSSEMNMKKYYQGTQYQGILSILVIVHLLPYMIGHLFLTTKLGCGQLYPRFTYKEMES